MRSAPHLIKLVNLKIFGQNFSLKWVNRMWLTLSINPHNASQQREEGMKTEICSV